MNTPTRGNRKNKQVAPTELYNSYLLIFTDKIDVLKLVVLSDIIFRRTLIVAAKFVNDSSKKKTVII